MDTKVCRVCGEEKLGSEFDRHKNLTRSLAHWCKQCRRAWTNSVYLKRPEVKARRKAYEKARNQTARARALQCRNAKRSRLKAMEADIKGFKLREMLGNARNRAKRLGFEFALTSDDFPDFRLIERCPILGIVFCWDSPDKLQRGSPTIDRIDSTKGYTRENAIIICHRANTIKNNGTAAEHKAIADFIDSLGK